MADLHCLLYTGKIDILFVTESWLHPGMPDGLLDPQGKYSISIIRRDRPAQRGGGVCIMIEKTIPYYEIHCDANDSVESVAVDVMFSSCKYRFVNVYRPPSHGAHKKPHVKELMNSVKKLCSVKWPVTVVGDLNCPDVNWNDSTSPCDGVQDKLLDCFCKFGMVQLVNDITCNDHILDLVLTNEPLIITQTYVDAPFASSDHNTVRFSVAVDRVSEPISSNLTSAAYCWHKADFNGLNERLMNFDWNQMMTVNLDANTLWASFNQVLQSAINDFVPIHYIPSRKQVTARYPAQIHAALTRKRCLWKLRKRNPNDVTISNNYRRQVAECRKLIREYEIKREETVIQANNVGKVYSFVNGKMTCHSGVGALKTSDGCIVLSDSAKAELLNEYFVSTGILDNGVLPPVKPLVTDDTFLESVNCGEDKIRKEIKMMKANGSAGPDGYPPILLKKLVSSLVTPLSLLYSSLCQ